MDKYDYFVYVNCGVSGPSAKWSTLPWTDVLTLPMEVHPTVKMTGLTMNCPTPRRRRNSLGRKGSHIQSMVYALDKIGFQLIRNVTNNVIFDCTTAQDDDSPTTRRNNIILQYEIGMSQLILQHGYGISPIIGPTIITFTNQSICQQSDYVYYHDVWKANKMSIVFGKNDSIELDDAIFIKTSRVMSPRTQQQIGYNYTFNWGQ